MSKFKDYILLPVILTLFDGNTNVTTDGGLSDEMKTFYSDYLIDMAEPELVHDQFGPVSYTHLWHMAKSKYETHVLPYLDKVETWARAGATAKEIAEKLHIAYSTFRKYLDEGENGDERYTALSVAFVRACEEPDDNVEAALYKRACGFEYVETKREQRLDRAGNVVELCLLYTSRCV